jgi:hypothetical protein
MAKKYTTTRKAIGETRTLFGTNYKLVVPYSSKRTHAGYTFSIGAHKFLAPLNSKLLYDIDKLPASWLIDLNASEEVTA